MAATRPPAAPARVTPHAGRGPADRAASGVSAPVRPGRRTKLLVQRLQAGEIALIDHLDIDRVSAEELIAAGVRAVLNCSRSSSGRYPNLGPALLVEAGVLLVDLDDDGIFEAVGEGEPVQVLVTGEPGSEHVAAEVWSVTGAVAPRAARDPAADGQRLLARGSVLDAARVRRETAQRERDIGDAMERFALNTIEHMREERELLAGRIDLPRFRTDFRDRPALVVVRGVEHQRDLRALRRFILDMQPVLVAVDGGADALLDEGLRPDMIVGDMDSASELALRCGAELVVHSYRDGRAPGRARVEALGLGFALVPAPGTSQDVALLLAAEKGANLIVSLGSPLNLVEFLDRNRDGMASTFLTRLRIGEILIDAKGVSRLYRPGPER